jgi:glycosyltransferase involved in cell wall biosynthesis
VVVKEPKVSIGMPVYNGEKYLENALKGLIEQDYENYELIISDNASIDGTSEICQGYARKDRRIRYSRNSKNIGLSANHNRTFEMARGKYFKWVAHDDEFPRDMLGRFVQVLDQASLSEVLVYSFCEFINDRGKLEYIHSDAVALKDARPYKRLAHLLGTLSRYNPIYGLIRSDVLRQTRLIGAFPASDHVLLAELSMLGEFVEIQEPLLRIRCHAERSFTACKTHRELLELFNPCQVRRFSLLDLWSRVHLELIKSAVLIPMKARDKMSCTAIALFVPLYWRLKNFAGRQKRKIYKVFYTVAKKNINNLS